MLSYEQLETYLKQQMEINAYLVGKLEQADRQIEFLLNSVVVEKERLPRSVRNRILKRDRYKCVECGESERLHIHHIISVANGGQNDDSNLQTLCVVCHMEKHEGESAETYLKSHLLKL